MPKRAAQTSGDLVIDGRRRLGLACAMCERIGSYGLAGLVSAHGINARVPDLLAELSADCPERAGSGLGTDRCGAVYLTVDWIGQGS
jgi:hypothetical protein